MVMSGLSWRLRGNPNWFWALKDVDLSLADGMSLGVIGANGSGKTTLLRLIAGVTRPTCGTLQVHGRIVPMLELFAGMQPEFTGRENVYLNGILLGMRRREIERKFDQIVDFAGVRNFLDMPLKHYSTGMGMKLGFGVAIHTDVQIMLLDEAWSIGDAEFQAKSLAQLHELRRKGITLIIVSHDLGLIQTLSDQALWLDHGLVRDFGPTQQVIDSYLRMVRPR